jgi:pimeloyl-ACP methyl ester carboxylesterase
MRGSVRARRRRRAPRRLWPWLGLAALGVVAVAAASRRRRFELFAEWDDDPAGAPTRPPQEPLPPPAPLSPTWIPGPAGNLFVRDTEAAPGALLLPVVFVHGLGGNGGQWALQLDHLQTRRRALALDLRGHGDSDPADDGDYTIPALAQDIAAVVDQLALRRFVLVGHSLGAVVAIRYAGRLGERVAGLLLVDPSGDQTRLPKGEAASFLEALEKNPVGELESSFRQLLVGGDREASAWVLEDLHLTHEAAIPAAVAGSFGYSPLADLRRYPGPRLSLISDLNSLPISLHKLAPNLPIRLVSGTGHWLMMDRPEHFNAILDGFLARVES